LFVGCGPAFRVSKGDTRIKGIPFFVKTAKCEHSTAYVFPFYVITYQTLSNGKVQTTESVTISVAEYNAEEVTKFLEILRKKNDPLDPNDITSANENWNKIKKAPYNIDPYNNVVGKSGRDPVTNTATAKLLVDYTNPPYTLNSRTPFAGSVNVAYKLSPDGTLSEGSAQIEDKTFETVLNFISETLKTAATAGAFALDQAGKPQPESRSLQGTVEKRALKITYSQIEDFTVGCKVTSPIQPNTTGSFVVEEIGPKDASKDDAKPKDNEITVTGKITLPEKPKTDGTAEAGAADATPAAPAKKPAPTKKSTGKPVTK
jgi:hypothetical protein